MTETKIWQCLDENSLEKMFFPFSCHMCIYQRISKEEEKNPDNKYMNTKHSFPPQQSGFEQIQTDRMKLFSSCTIFIINLLFIVFFQKTLILSQEVYRWRVFFSPTTAYVVLFRQQKHVFRFRKKEQGILRDVNTAGWQSSLPRTLLGTFTALTFVLLLLHFPLTPPSAVNL